MVTLKGKETELAAGSKLRAVSTVADLAEKSPDSDNALKVLPQGSKPWYRTWHLVKLNLILMVPLVSSAVDDEFLHGDINSYHSSSQNRNVRAREPKG
ncbi:hypothetical protein AFGD_003896 [Aspergillus flavus]|nr:hypothetical protein AFGD_003896 [Aspergillus flavus]